MRRFLLLWFLVALFCLAGVGAIIMVFTATDTDLQSRLISLVFVAVFFFMAYHFASMAIHPTHEPTMEERRQGAAKVAAVQKLPVIEYPESLILKAGEVCCYQAKARVLEEPEVAKWFSTPRTYPGDFSITNGRLVMTGRRKFSHPLSALTGMSMYNELQGVCLEFGNESYTLLMDEPYWVPKILELLGIRC